MSCKLLQVFDVVRNFGCSEDIQIWCPHAKKWGFAANRSFFVYISHQKVTKKVASFATLENLPCKTARDKNKGGKKNQDTTGGEECNTWSRAVPKRRTQNASQALPFCFVLWLHVPSGAAALPAGASGGAARAPRPGPPRQLLSLSRAIAASLAPSLHYLAISGSTMQLKKQPQYYQGQQLEPSYIPTLPTGIGNKPLLSQSNTQQRSKSALENPTQTKHQKRCLLRTCGFPQCPPAFWGRGKADGSEAQPRHPAKTPK